MTYLISSLLLAAVALAYSIGLARDAWDEWQAQDAAEVATDSDARGEVIPGLCPARVDPVQVNASDSPLAYADPGADWNLRGEARPGANSLTWDRPDSVNITGFVVARHVEYTDTDSYPVWQVAPDSLRTFAVDATGEVQTFHDWHDIEPETTYRYRVFPVSDGSLGAPSLALEVWSLPLTAPRAPVWAVADYAYEDWYVLAQHSFGDPVTGMRVLRRSGTQDSWKVVHEEVAAPDRTFRVVDEVMQWADTEADSAGDYDYAVCFGNTAGFGRATLASPSLAASLQTVDADPPSNIKAIASQYGVTVYWDPPADPTATGYQVERSQRDEDDIWDLQLYAPRGTHFVYTSRGGADSEWQSDYRVRAVTEDGFGQWSDWVAVEIPTLDASEGAPDQPEIVLIDSSHSEVNFVWRTDHRCDDCQFRVLRREVGTESEFNVRLLLYGSVAESEFDWDWAYSPQGYGWTDEFDVRPDTEYEYAVQLKRGDFVGAMSEVATVRTLPVPSDTDRRPLPVHNLQVLPADDGIKVTWDLPDDPARTGIYVQEIFGQGYAMADRPRNERQELVQVNSVNDLAVQIAWNPSVETDPPYRSPVVFHQWPPLVLGADATEHTALTRRYEPGPNRYCWEVVTFNEYGRQSQGFQHVCMEPSEMVHCPATTEEVDQQWGVSIRFRSCEESVTTVIRHEVTADGIDTRQFNQPCEWTPIAEEPRSWLRELYAGTMYCEYEDEVTPGTMYIYELRQTFADGRTAETVGEEVTGEWVE